MFSRGTAAPTGEHLSLLSCLVSDSMVEEVTPANHAQAARLGGKWPASEQKELGNHSENGSWERITIDDVPQGRRLHKLVWVYKIKRDGTYKSRLCVQGCTMIHGQDFDQVHASTLRTSSVRTLTAFAARHGCSIRSVDWVAAYLQGELLEGEVVYCHMPPGYQEYDPQGRPYVFMVVKPIYGIPQAGRRFQRAIFPWIRAQGFRQLDESDSSVWVYDPSGKTSKDEIDSTPSSHTTMCAPEPPVPDASDTKTHKSLYASKSKRELLVLGVYVDNLQIVHSADINDKSSKVYSFLQALQSRWKVEDEGPMVDILGIQIKHNPDKSITLHQGKYVDKMFAEFLPNGIPSHIPRNCLPYSTKLASLVADATFHKDTHKYPELLEPYQRRLGSLMYLANSCRPDIAYPIGMHCRNMGSPTPELLRELDYVFVYVHRTSELGLTYDAAPTKLHGFTDASLGDSYSTSGYSVHWQGAVISWCSTKQKSVSLSSCEAEIYALSEGAKDLAYFRKLLSGLGEDMSSPTDLSTDNKGAADLSHNPEHHRRSKHVERRHFFVRDMVEAMQLRVPLVRTDDNLADLYTKSVPPKRFRALRARIMNEQPSRAKL